MAREMELRLKPSYPAGYYDVLLGGLKIGRYNASTDTLKINGDDLEGVVADLVWPELEVRFARKGGHLSIKGRKWRATITRKA